MANCLVFGGLGFIGDHLVQRLLHDGDEVKVFDIMPYDPKGSDLEITPTIITGDFLDHETVSTAMADVDYIFHYITVTNPGISVQDPSKEIKNLKGTLNILKAATENNIKKIIYPSSGGTIYGSLESLPIPEHNRLQPTTPYAITKVMIEHLLGFYFEQYGLDYSVLRISNPYGPGQKQETGQGVIASFFDQMLRSEPPIIYGDGSNVRDYIYISDVIEANILAMNTRSKTKTFNVGSGQGVSLDRLLELISEIVGKKIAAQYNDAQKHDIAKIYLDISLIHKTLDWEVKIDLKTGLEKTWAWFNRSIEK